MRPVHVTMLGERALVEGGQLPREHGWIAELTHTHYGQDAVHYFEHQVIAS